MHGVAVITQIIISSFKKCCIINKLDGSANDDFFLSDSKSDLQNMRIDETDDT